MFLALAAGLAAQVPQLVVPIGHTGIVTAAAFSPDGQQVLTGSWDGTAKLWDLRGREIKTFSGHTSGVSSVAFSANGQQVLTASFDNTVKLWSLSGGEPLTFKHTSHVNSAAFSPDGKTVLTGSGDGIARLWNVSGGAPKTLSGHDSEITSVAFSPDGQKVLTGSFDKTAKLWDLSGGAPQTFSGHFSVVSSVAFSPDGQKVLTGSWDGATKLWPVAGGNPQTFKGHAFQVRAVAFSPDGNKIGTGGGDGTVIWWDLSGRDSLSFSGHAVIISSIAFSPDGQKLLTGSFDKTAGMWSLSGQEMQRFRGHSFPISSVAWSPQGRQILAGSTDGMAKLWHLPGRDVQTFRGHDTLVWSVAFSPDGQQVLTASADSTAKLWNLSGRETQTFKGHRSTVYSAAFSPDGRQVLTASADSTAKLWNLSGREIQTFKGHASFVRSAAFSPDGRQVLTGSGDRSAKLWDLSGGVKHTFSDPAGRVSSVAFSPDGQKVLTGGSDKTAKLWAASGGDPRTFSGHADALTSVAFSSDGQKILTGSGDRTAKWWSLSSPDTLTLRGHTSFVRSAVFSPDGRKVLTGSDDNTVKIWDANSGQCLMTFISLDTSEWVVTTPFGLFDASPGAMKLMYYTQGLEVIELGQLKERYYEPGLLGKLLGFNDDPLRSVEGFGALPLYPKLDAAIGADQLSLAVTLTPRSGGIGKLSLFVNGKEVLEDANPQRAERVSIDLTQFAEYYLPGENNLLALRAYNAQGWLKSSALELGYQPPAIARGTSSGPAAATLSRPKPALYAIVIGTADYSGDKLDLKYADLDAVYFSQALRAAAPGVYADKVAITLLNTRADDPERQGISSKAAIRQAFVDLVIKAKAQDVLMVYFSGHGVTYGAAENAQFYYLTKDIASENLSDPEIRNNYAVSSAELTEWIKAIPALKQVMVIDACNSGKIVEDLAVRKDLSSTQIRALDRMKDRTGMFILTGSAADMVSYEAGQYGQGLLTFSLLEGMSGPALSDGNVVDVMTLFQHARNRVPELARGIGGIQSPVLAFPDGGASFDIGLVGPGVKIPLAKAKPVFVRNNFLDDDIFDDRLGLSNALADYFRSITSKGAQADMLYWDNVNEYENAYSIKGLYTVSGDVVTVRARLFKGKMVVGDKFSVTGKKSNVPALVEAIIGKVQGMVK